MVGRIAFTSCFIGRLSFFPTIRIYINLQVADLLYTNRKMDELSLLDDSFGDVGYCSSSYLEAAMQWCMEMNYYT